jgi:hypothetical protein
MTMRPCGRYGLFKDDSYPAYILDSGDVQLVWTGTGQPPEGFEADGRVNKAVRIVPLDDLDSLVDIKTTCQWRGGPFFIITVGWEHVIAVYDGEDKMWALAQPGVAVVDSPRDAGWLEVTFGRGEAMNVTETVVHDQLALLRARA